MNKDELFDKAGDKADRILDKVADKAADKADDHDARKARLLRQGEFHRIAILHAKQQVKQAARPQAIFHDVLDHASYALRSRVDGLLKPTGVNVASLAPYALSLFGLIRRRGLGKPALAVSVALAGVGWFLQRRRQRLAATGY